MGWGTDAKVIRISGDQVAELGFGEASAWLQEPWSHWPLGGAVRQALSAGAVAATRPPPDQGHGWWRDVAVLSLALVASATQDQYALKG